MNKAYLKFLSFLYSYLVLWCVVVGNKKRQIEQKNHEVKSQLETLVDKVNKSYIKKEKEDNSPMRPVPLDGLISKYANKSTIRYAVGRRSNVISTEDFTEVPDGQLI